LIVFLPHRPDKIRKISFSPQREDCCLMVSPLCTAGIFIDIQIETASGLNVSFLNIKKEPSLEKSCFYFSSASLNQA